MVVDGPWTTGRATMASATLILAEDDRTADRTTGSSQNAAADHPAGIVPVSTARLAARSPRTRQAEGRHSVGPGAARAARTVLGASVGHIDQSVRRGSPYERSGPRRAGRRPQGGRAVRARIACP